jgi:hypothetical protein
MNAENEIEEDNQPRNATGFGFEINHWSRKSMVDSNLEVAHNLPSHVQACEGVHNSHQFFVINQEAIFKWNLTSGSFQNVGPINLNRKDLRKI